MKPDKTEVAASVDRFVADIAAIIARHAERVIAEALARRGLTAVAPPRRATQPKVTPKRQPRRTVAVAGTEPAPSKRPEQLSLF